jgi:hypothetical protein
MEEQSQTDGREAGGEERVDQPLGEQAARPPVLAGQHRPAHQQRRHQQQRRHRHHHAGAPQDVEANGAAARDRAHGDAGGERGQA